MSALTYHLVVNQGSNYVLTIPVLDGTTPVTVTGWTVNGQIRRQHDSATVLHTLSLTATGSSVILQIPAEVSSEWAWRVGKYDVELASPDGLITTRLIEGLVVVRPEVTR
jgi:hypothetical protein